MVRSMEAYKKLLREIENNIYVIDKTDNNLYNVRVFWKISGHLINSRDINDSGWMDINIKKFNVLCDWPSDPCQDCKKMKNWIEEGRNRYSTEYVSANTTKVLLLQQW